MFIVKEPKDEYLIHKRGDKYIVCRIIKECDSEQEAVEELLKAMNKED